MRLFSRRVVLAGAGALAMAALVAGTAAGSADAATHVTPPKHTHLAPPKQHNLTLFGSFGSGVSARTIDLGGVKSVATGGTFVTSATQVGTIKLKAGTYLLNVSAKATPPSGGTGAVQIFPEFFVYNQAVSPSFAGDLINVGSGALESGANSNIDSYYSGSGEVVVPSRGETLHVYAFGYDSDRGSSSYALDDLSVTATHLG